MSIQSVISPPEMLPVLRARYAVNKSINSDLGPNVTGVRNSARMYMNAAGVMVSAASGVPRYHHRYRNGQIVSAGWLVEDARTNQLTHSVDFSDWNVDNLVLTPNHALAPDGTMTATRVVESTDGASTYHRFYKNAVFTSGRPYSASIFFKPSQRPVLYGTSSGPFLYETFFNTVSKLAEEILPFGAEVSANFTLVDPYPNDWYRLIVNGIAASTTSAPVQWFSTGIQGLRDYQGAGLEVGWIWGAQLEEGYGSTMPILTDDEPVTVEGDLLSLSGSSFTPLFNRSGMLVVETSHELSVKSTVYAEINDGSQDNRLTLARNASGAFEATVKASGVTAFNNTTNKKYADFETVRHAISFSPTKIFAANKTVVSSSVNNADVPYYPVQLELGKDFNGCISLLELYKPQRTPTEFLALTGTLTAYQPDNSAINYSDYELLRKNSNKAEMYRNSGFAIYRDAAPGARVRFNTTHEEIHVRLTSGSGPLDEKLGTGVILVDGAYYSRFIMPAVGTDIAVPVYGTGDRLIEVIMPISWHVQFRGVHGFGSGTISAPTSRPTKKYLFIGDSMTQGFFASDPTKTWPYLLCGLQNAQMLNHGFGSSNVSDLMDDTVETNISNSLSNKIFYCAVANDFNQQQPLATVESQLLEWHTRVRAALPLVPIYMGGPWYIDIAGKAIPASDYRSMVEDLVAEIDEANTFVIDTLTASGDTSISYWPDDIHASDLGQAAIATYIDANI